MPSANPQTVRHLDRGSHASPDDGVCVMELASMLANERFSDKPRCVDPVVAAFLRAWNDRLGHATRQRLFPYAARAVGTNQGRALARRRLDLCLTRSGIGREGAGGARRRLTALSARLVIAFTVGLPGAIRLSRGAPEYAVLRVLAQGDPEKGFELLDALLDLGGDGPLVPPSPPPPSGRDILPRPASAPPQAPSQRRPPVAA